MKGIDLVGRVFGRLHVVSPRAGGTDRTPVPAAVVLSLRLWPRAASAGPRVSIAVARARRRDIAAARIAGARFVTELGVRVPAAQSSDRKSTVGSCRSAGAGQDWRRRAMRAGASGARRAETHSQLRLQLAVRLAKPLPELANHVARVRTGGKATASWTNTLLGLQPRRG